MKRVLLINEQGAQFPFLTAKLLSLRPQNDVVLEQVATFLEAMDRAGEEWDLIVWMNHVPGVPTAIQRVRTVYSGPMLAASSVADFREKMVQVGCSHNLGGDDKLQVPAKIVEILGLS